MSAKHRFNFDETKFRPGQQRAALLLVERDFAPRDERKTLQEIAEEVGITRQGIHKWNTQDPNFIAYKNYLASEFMDTHLSLVYSKLIDVVKAENTKGIELFLKRIGDLDTKSEVTLNDNRSEESFEDRKAALLERLGSDEEN